jgi:S-formylglutathione hydrolase FrmB
MPDGKNSYYINDYQGNIPYEDFFIQEFISYIDEQYPVSYQANQRAIAGLSMGGYGAVVLSIKHPDLFGTCLAFSAALRTDSMFSKLPQQKYDQYFGKLFGNDLSGIDRLTRHWKNNNPLYIIDKGNHAALQQIAWYIDCGMDDFLFVSNQALHQKMLKFHIAHEYHMRPGKHNWDYWQQSVTNGLLFWNVQLKQ